MKTSRAGCHDSSRRGRPRARRAGIWGRWSPPRVACRSDGLNSRVPGGGTRAPACLGRDVVAVVALGLLEEAPLEDLALGLAGETDLRARVVGLALELAQLALGDRRRAVAVVLVLGQQVPGEHGELAGGRADRDLLAAAGGDPGVEGAQRARCADRGV